MTLSGAGRRRKGAGWRSLSTAYLQTHVDPAITASLDGAATDRGDAAGLPCIIEFKNHQAIELGEWASQAEKAAITCHLYRWLLWVKRRGRPDAKDAFMVVPGWFGAELLSAWLAQRKEIAS